MVKTAKMVCSLCALLGALASVPPRDSGWKPPRCSTPLPPTPAPAPPVTFARRRQPIQRLPRRQAWHCTIQGPPTSPPTATLNGTIPAQPNWSPYATPGTPSSPLLPQDPNLPYSPFGSQPITMAVVQKFFQDVQADYHYFAPMGTNYLGIDRHRAECHLRLPDVWQAANAVAGHAGVCRACLARAAGQRHAAGRHAAANLRRLYLAPRGTRK